eukprot:5749575-Alexandrium_andersonii.AAC.1
MSASLVGSEMCIRDSAPCSPIRPHGQPCSASARIGLQRFLQMPALAWGCLLYTSDAADDM